jgi:hypothetical protein
LGGRVTDRLIFVYYSVWCGKVPQNGIWGVMKERSIARFVAFVDLVTIRIHPVPHFVAIWALRARMQGYETST